MSAHRRCARHASLALLLATLALPHSSTALLYRHMVERNSLAAYRRSQIELADRWQYDPKLLCATSLIHGNMNKSASVNDMPWVLFRKATRRTLPESVPIYARPSMYISHKYRLIYIRQQKSSSSSMLAALAQLLCADPTACQKDEFGHADVGITNETWRTYFVFTWVRNPWMRMISTYNMICTKFLRYRDPVSDLPGEPCCVTFEQFGHDPYSLIETCNTDRCCPWNDNKWDFMFIAGHINDQTHTIFTSDRRSLVDFIGRTEHMVDDWAELVRQINNFAGTNFPPPALPQINPSEPVGGENVVVCQGKELPKVNESTMHSMAEQFAMDIVRFGYIPPANALDPSNDFSARRRTATTFLRV